MNQNFIDYVKISLKEIVYRASFIVSGPENLIKKSYLIVNSHFSLYEENEKNASEIEIFKLKELSKEILTLENIKYKRLIDDYFIKENETYAKVLIDKQSPFLRSVIINKGSKNNVKLGMIVLDEGYLVEALINYLVKTGWSHGDQEFFSTDDLLKLFTIDKVTKSSAIFDYDKLNWLNQHYIKNKDLSDIADMILPYLTDLNIKVSDRKYLENILSLGIDRDYNLKNIASGLTYYFENDLNYNYLFHLFVAR